MTERDAPCSTGSVSDEGMMAVNTQDSPTCLQRLSQLDPVYWSSLPEEVLELVFAKLPVPDIQRLRCLSTSWRRNMVERSLFSRLCTKTHPKMFGLILEHVHVEWNGLCWVMVYDMTTNKWHQYKLIVGSPERQFQTLSAADGGLVCFLSMWHATKECPFQVVVCNPLTQNVRRFMLEGLSTHQVEFLKIVTDQETGHYKLIVGWLKHVPLARNTFTMVPSGTSTMVDVFDSKSEEWINLDLSKECPCRDLFWGDRHNWVYSVESEPNDYYPQSNNVGPYVWDCAEHRMHELDDIPHVGDTMEDYALLEDRLFVLHEESKTCPVGIAGDPDNQGSIDSENSDSDNSEDVHYCISEYQGRTKRPSWVHLRTISCGLLELPPATTSYQMRLQACEGFLLLESCNDPALSPHIELETLWLYDLSTNEWRALPSLPGGLKLLDIRNSSLCKLRWDLDLNPLNVPCAEQVLLHVSSINDEDVHTTG